MGWSLSSTVPLTILSPSVLAIGSAQCSTLVGNGLIDNTQLLQSCLDTNAPTAGGTQIRYLRIPVGTFLLRSAVTVRPGEVLIGSSSTSTKFIGTPNGPQPDAWFTLSQYTGLANISIDAPNAVALVAGSDLSGNPMLSGHQFLENLDLNSTPSGSNVHTWNMVGLAGPDLQVYNSRFLSGTNVGLRIDYGDGAIVSGNTFINNLAENYFNADQNLIIEANTVYSELGPGPSGNDNGNAAFDLVRTFCVYCQSMVTRNEYIGYNTIHDLGMLSHDMQVIQMDGGAGAYYGSVASSTVDTVVLADDPNWVRTGTGDLEGISVAIVLGQGVGQQSFIKSVDGRAITLKTPWKVIPDSTSLVVITAAEPNLIIAHNTISNTQGVTICPFRMVDAVIEDNVLVDSGMGIFLWGQGPYGGASAFDPNIDVDVLRNNIETGTGEYLYVSPLDYGAGIGIEDNDAIMVSGLMIRNNYVTPLQSIYSTNGVNGINASVVERNRANWVDNGYKSRELLIQNNVSP